jgi:hypothetical protein
MVRYKFCYLIILFTLNSCSENKVFKYEDGGSYSESYFPNGSIKQSVHYIDLERDVFTTKVFTPSGTILSKGSFLNFKPIGPVEYFDSNGKIVLYNEIDYEQQCYYLKKYSKDSIILEKGIAIVPKLFKISGDSNKAEFLFCYSEPYGYRNKISVYLNESKFKYLKYPENHFGIIQIDGGCFSDQIEMRLKIESELLCGDSLILRETLFKKISKESLLKEVL